MENINLEKEYCYLLNSMLESSELFEYLEQIQKNIEKELLGIDNRLSEPSHHYKASKKYAIICGFVLCANAVGVATIIDYFVTSESPLQKTFLGILYTTTIMIPALMIPVIHYKDKEKFDRFFELRREYLLDNKYLLEYAQWLNDVKMNGEDFYNSIWNGGLTDDEWNRFELLEEKFVLAKKRD